jgi:ABC-type uncharacterized transport system involved in gliding motility auxiliary subunit
MNRKKNLYITIALLAGIVIMINLLSTEFHLRLDLTEGGQYTLSPATKDILHDLQEPVTVKAYFSRNLPPNIDKARKDFQDLLVEYASRAHGMVRYSFVNPNENEAREQEAQQKGIRPVLINVRQKDQMQQQKAYLGAVLSLGDRGGHSFSSTRIAYGICPVYGDQKALRHQQARRRLYTGPG